MKSTLKTIFNICNAVMNELGSIELPKVREKHGRI